MCLYDPVPPPTRVSLLVHFCVPLPTVSVRFLSPEVSLVETVVKLKCEAGSLDILLVTDSSGKFDGSDNRKRCLRVL